MYRVCGIVAVCLLFLLPVTAAHETSSMPVDGAQMQSESAHLAQQFYTLFLQMAVDAYTNAIMASGMAEHQPEATAALVEQMESLPQKSPDISSPQAK